MNYCKYIKGLIVALLLLLLGVGCKEVVYIEDDQDDDLLKVGLVLSDFTKETATRALDPIRDNLIREIDMFLFLEKNGQFYFDSYIPVDPKDIKDNTSDGKSKTIIANFIKPTVRMELVVLANSRACIPNNLQQGVTTRETFFKSVKFSLPADYKWKANNDSSFVPFPMFGTTGPMLISGSGGLNVVYMNRALAKVSVSVDRWINDFALKKVHLIDVNTQGLVGPINTVPTPPITHKGPVTYDIPNGDYNFEDVIYMMERDEPALDQGNSITRIVLEGVYKGELTWYRLDFGYPARKPSTDGGFNEAYMVYSKISRNKNYRFNIGAVYKKGYGSLNEAANGVSIQFNESFKVDYTVDDMYYYSDGITYAELSNNRFNLYGSPAPEYSVNIRSNRAWQAVVPSEYPWLSITEGESGAASTPGTIKFAVQPLPANVGVRYGKIEVFLGTVNRVIEVVQFGECYTIPSNTISGVDYEFQVQSKAQPIGKTMNEYMNLPDNMPIGFDSSFAPWLQKSTIDANSCVALNTGGKSDWRLPTYLESRAIVNYWGNNINIFCDPDSFVSRTAPYYIGSGRTRGDYEEDDYTYTSSYEIATLEFSLFGPGTGDRFGYSYNKVSYYGYVETHRFQNRALCVRSDKDIYKPKSIQPSVANGLTSELYIAAESIHNAGGVFLDKLQYNPYGNEVNYYAYANLQDGDNTQSKPRPYPARPFSCAKLGEVNYGGYSDWRLPTYDELLAMHKTINTPELEKEYGFPAWNSRCKCSFLTSETTSDNKYVYLHVYGNSKDDVKLLKNTYPLNTTVETIGMFVRCVRGNQ